MSDRTEAFMADLWRLWRDSDWFDLDGGDLHALFEKHGFVELRAVTGEYVTEDSEFVTGDTMYVPAGDLKSILESR